MYKAMTLPRARKEAEDAESSSPAISGSVPSLKAAVTGKKEKKLKNRSATISAAQSSTSIASTTETVQSKRSLGGSNLSLVSDSPKKAKKKIKGIIKGSKRLFRNKKESVPIAVETSLDLNRTMTAESPSPPVNDEPDAAAGVPEATPEDWSVTTTYERAKIMSVVESVYQDGGEVEQQKDESEVRSTTLGMSEPEVVSDSSSVPVTPTAETQNFSPSSSFKLSRQSSTALKEEIMRKTSGDNGAYLISKMSRDRLLNPQVCNYGIFLAVLCI